jgi:hypothetical protein
MFKPYRNIDLIQNIKHKSLLWGFMLEAKTGVRPLTDTDHTLSVLSDYIITYLGVCEYRRGMDWMSDLLTTLQFTTAPAKPFPAVSW